MMQLYYWYELQSLTSNIADSHENLSFHLAQAWEDIALLSTLGAHYSELLYVGEIIIPS